MKFGAKIAQRRESRGLTPEKLGQKLGVDAKSVQQWESGEEFPAKVQLLALGCALKLKPESMLRDDADEMMKHINAMEMRETVGLAGLSFITLACALALIAISDIAPDMLGSAATATQVVLAGTFFVILIARRSDSAMRARRYTDALESIDGGQSGFVLKRKAGKSTGLVIAQFVFGCVIAFTLIILLGVIMPESNLPWVML